MKKNLGSIVRHIFFLLIFFFLVYSYSIQRNNGVSWDFLVYVDNGRFFAGEGLFFEWMRPPLFPVILAIAGVSTSWAFAPYFVIILFSGLLVISAICMANKYGVDQFLFLIFLISPVMLIYGMINGTELPSLVFVILYFVFSSERYYLSITMLALSSLLRYSNIAFFVLPLISKPERFYQVFIVAIILFTPWLYYNYTSTGSFWTSLANQYANNIYFRQYMSQKIDISAIFRYFGIIIYLALAGLIYIRRVDIPLVLLVFILFSQYYKIPLKDLRYLFLLLLPLSYFSTRFVSEILGFVWIKFYGDIVKQRYKDLLKCLLGIIFIFYSFYIFQNNIHGNTLIDIEPYLKYASYFDRCMLKSNLWPILSYYGYTSEAYPPEYGIDYYLSRGYRIVLYKNIFEPSYSRALVLREKYPVIYDDKNIIVIGGEDCISPRISDKTYLELRTERLLMDENIFEPYYPCDILFYPKICQYFR